MNELTARIAVAAAQWVADEGMDYEQAKRRAARMIAGKARSVPLPSNEAVEDEVRTHIALFQSDTQPGELAALRLLALRWMERLQDFRPHLAGAVWRGTANRHSSVRIELYGDDTKTVEIALINMGVRFDPGTAPGDPGREPIVLTLADRCPELPAPVTVQLQILDHDDLRGALRPDSSGRTWRGDVVALRRLLAAQDGGVPEPSDDEGKPGNRSPDGR